MWIGRSMDCILSETGKVGKESSLERRKVENLCLHIDKIYKQPDKSTEQNK